jgi:hypothetical protein
MALSIGATWFVYFDYNDYHLVLYLGGTWYVILTNMINKLVPYKKESWVLQLFKFIRFLMKFNKTWLICNFYGFSQKLLINYHIFSKIILNHFWQSRVALSNFKLLTWVVQGPKVIWHGLKCHIIIQTLFFQVVESHTKFFSWHAMAKIHAWVLSTKNFGANCHHHMYMFVYYICTWCINAYTHYIHDPSRFEPKISWNYIKALTTKSFQNLNDII